MKNLIVLQLLAGWGIVYGCSNQKVDLLENTIWKKISLLLL